MANDIRRKPEGALLRTYLSAAGLSSDSNEKPLVGVATVATQIFSENPDAVELGKEAAAGVEAAGGVALKWNSVRSPELMSWGHAESYSFAWRDQLADNLESWAHQQALDGLVLVGDAPETLVGMTMAATRLNVPAIIVTSGVTRWDFSKENEEAKKNKEYSNPYELMAQALYSKKKTAQEPSETDALTQCNLSPDDHSAYAVDLVLEGLGVTLPGMSTAGVKSTKRKDLAKSSGEKVVALVKTGYPLRRVLTANAFMNAIRLNAALGGSVDILVHLVALANEAGVALSMDTFDKIALQTPQICNLGGVSQKQAHKIEELDAAGGVWALFHALKSQISPTTTLSGKGAMELAKASTIKDTHVISAHRVIKKQSGIGLLKGNLAPNGAVFLLNQVLPELNEIKGDVQVFESEVEAAEAVTAGKIKKGKILIVRGMGPKGGPGLPKLRILPALLESRGLNKTVPLITDGRLPDTPAGLFISLVSPEGHSSGPMGIIKDGDGIEIDVEKRSINVRLTDTELRIRMARWQAPQPKSKRGFLGRYSRQVSEVNEGAILK